MYSLTTKRPPGRSDAPHLVEQMLERVDVVEHLHGEGDVVCLGLELDRR